MFLNALTSLSPLLILTTISYFLHKGITFQWWNNLPYFGFKIVGGHKMAWYNGKLRTRWEADACDVLRQGFKETRGGPFQVIATQGPLVILPTSMMGFILENKHFSFAANLERMGLRDFPRLGTKHLGTQRDIVFETVRTPFTKSARRSTGILSARAEILLTELFPVQEDIWQSSDFISPAKVFAARLSAILFVGENLAENKDWQGLMQTFIPAAVSAELARQKWPVFLWPFLDNFLPEVRHLRVLVDSAIRMIREEIHARNTLDGRPLSRNQDCLDWFEEARRGREFDPVSGILFLLAAGTHNVSLSMTAIMYELLLRPELMDSIRTEVAGVITDGGWTKSSLDKMVLLDCFMRETQRYRMTDPAVLYRRVEKSLTLPDGSRLAKGTHTAFPSPRTLEDFRGSRFDHIHEISTEKSLDRFTTTGLNYLSMGHGKSACPGRFFASAEIKIFFAHLLLNYEWKAIGEIPPGGVIKQFEPIMDAVVAFRARTFHV